MAPELQDAYERRPLAGGSKLGYLRFRVDLMLYVDGTPADAIKIMNFRIMNVS